MIKIGDLVSRKSYNDDIVFEVIDIIGDLAKLHGKIVRLVADAPVDDLNIVPEQILKEIEHKERLIIQSFKRGSREKKNRKYLPGRILHMDGDRKYLEKCMKFYEELNLYAVGVSIKETDIPDEIMNFYKKIRPNVLIITGHDSYNKKGISDVNNYRNSKYFIEAIKKLREEKISLNDLIIFAGACQSHFEALIGAGANFASSPSRVNIHSLDPAIIAVKCCITPFYDIINIKDAINKTSHKYDGIGGLDSYGTLRILTSI